MTGAEGLAAAFVGGVLTSASPCVLAAVPVAVGFVGGQAVTPRRSAMLALAFVAGMNIALLAMGLAAARLGLMLGSLPGPWSVVVGLAVVGLAVWLWRTAASACGTVAATRMLSGIDKKAGIASVTSCPSILRPRYSGARPTISPAKNTARTT